MGVGVVFQEAGAVATDQRKIEECSCSTIGQKVQQVTASQAGSWPVNPGPG